MMHFRDMIVAGDPVSTRASTISPSNVTCVQIVSPRVAAAKLLVGVTPYIVAIASSKAESTASPSPSAPGVLGGVDVTAEICLVLDFCPGASLGSEHPRYGHCFQ